MSAAARGWLLFALLLMAVAAAVFFYSLLPKYPARANKETIAAAATANARREAAWPPAFPWGSAEPVEEPRAEHVELCGYGLVNPNRLPAGLEAEAQAAIARAIDHLGRSERERDRALALSMRALQEQTEARARAYGNDVEKCLATQSCLDRAMQAGQRAMVPTVQALARLAVTTRDPLVFVGARRLCQSAGAAASGECALLRAEQWAQLDPDNALAWIDAANAAMARKDEAAAAHAMLRASQARFANDRPTPYGDLLANVDTQSEAVQTLIHMQLASSYFGQWLPLYTETITWCAKDKVLDATRREVCSGIARLLLESDSALTGVLVGGSIAEKVGWPEEKLKAVRAEREALISASGTTASSDSYSCAGMARIRQMLDRLMGGEVKYLRALARERAGKAS